MLFRMLIGGVLAASAWAQPTPPQVELANLREDVRGLVQRVGELGLRIEQLERENGELRAKAGATDRSYATVAELRNAVNDLDRTIKSAVAESQTETLQRVAGQMEKLATQTNAALAELAKGQGAHPVAVNPAPAAAGPGAKPAATYTVEKGDSLASIAKKTGAKPQDIISANKLADPSHILVGQTLIIPVSK